TTRTGNTSEDLDDRGRPIGLPRPTRIPTGRAPVGDGRVPGLGSGVLQHPDRGLPDVPGPGYGRPEAPRGPLAAAGDPHHDLPPVEQRHDPSGREISGI